MTIEKISFKKVEKDGKIYTGEEYILGTRYIVERYETTYTDGTKLDNIYIKAADPADRYLPAIYYHDDFFGKKEPRFEIQTTAYGALAAEEIRKVLDGYTEALEAAAVLTAAFCKKEERQ